MKDLVTYEAADGIAVVTLDRPGKLNAIDGEIARSLDAAVERSETDEAVRAVILRSSSNKAFCAGADLAAASAGDGDSLYTARGGFAGFTDARRSKPWIAAVSGFAIGGGCEICLACEIIVATPGASFGLPEVQRGVLATAGGLSHLTSRLPRNVALEMILSGEPLGAERAYALGFVNQLAAPDELMPTARSIAARIAAAAPIAVAESLAIARDSSRIDERTGRSRTEKALERVRRSADFGEGIQAFLEKRAPVWTGR